MDREWIGKGHEHGRRVQDGPTNKLKDADIYAAAVASNKTALMAAFHPLRTFGSRTSSLKALR